MRKKSKIQSLYEILGINKSASKSDIKRAYRKRSFETHPDVKDGDGGEEFIRVQRAYQILINDDSKSRYDETGEEEDSGGIENQINGEARGMVISIWVGSVREEISRKIMSPIPLSPVSYLIHHVNVVKSRIHEERSKLEVLIRNREETIAHLIQIRDRIGGDESKSHIIASAMEDQILGCKKEVAGMKRRMEVCDRGLEMVDGVEYRIDEIPIQPLNTQDFGSKRHFHYVNSLWGRDTTR